jgi:photosystem II stability/assembly factor-like uncharacterized protein
MTVFLFSTLNNAKENMRLEWHRQTRITGNSLLGADFIDENVGWLVGNKGTILHTTDGVVNWSKQISVCGS